MFLSPENSAAPPRTPRSIDSSLAALFAALASVAAVACAGPGDDSVVLTSSALGEPNGDYPSYEERVVLYATNRARVSPTAEGWPSYPAQPPMQWQFDLNRSSRAHSLDMRDTPCFQHPSCDGTDTFMRVFTFYTGPWNSVAENISAGVSDPQAVVAGWISEKGAAPGETGHRDAIFSAKLDLIGVGFAAGGTTKTPNYWTQDFVETKITRPRLTDGIHFPKSVAAGGKVTFGATYYDAAAGAATPQVFVVVDGACSGLARVRGTAALAAHEGAVALADGCHAYYFVATAGDGVALAAYPTTGSLQVGAGSAAATCALFATARAATTCAGTAGGTAGAGGAGTAGVSGSAGATGAGGATGTGAAGTAGVAGTAGRTGASGATGSAGTTGATGTGGLTGTSGATGAAGMTGATGGAGTTGGTTGAAATTGGGMGIAGAGSGQPGAAGASSQTDHSPVTGVGGCSIAPDAGGGFWFVLGALGALATSRLRRRRA